MELELRSEANEVVGRDAGRDPDPVLYLIRWGTRLLSLLIHKLSPQSKPWYGTKGMVQHWAFREGPGCQTKLTKSVQERRHMQSGQG